MKKQVFVFIALLLTAFLSACVTSKTLQNEKEMEAWLSVATMPVTVRFQSNEMRCRPSLNCYTLIDAKGKIHYARNVRHALPRMIPEDSMRVRPTVLERILLGER
jgi:hypothetical protein